MADTWVTSPINSVITSSERKTPIRDFFFMQQQIMSIIFCLSPMSLMEPKDCLERRLGPLRPPGPWIDIKNQKSILLSFNLLSFTRAFISILSGAETFWACWGSVSSIEPWEPKELPELCLDPLLSSDLWINMIIIFYFEWLSVFTVSLDFIFPLSWCTTWFRFLTLPSSFFSAISSRAIRAWHSAIDGSDLKWQSWQLALKTARIPTWLMMNKDKAISDFVF